MGNKLKTKKKPSFLPKEDMASFPQDQRAFYLDPKTENESMTSIKKSPIPSEMSEDNIKMSPENAKSTATPRKEEKFSLTRSQVFGSACMLQVNLENIEYSHQLCELIVYEPFFEVMPSKKRALAKLKNSNFWVDLLNKKMGEKICPNEYRLKLNKMHVVCEVFEFQKELRPETLDSFRNCLFSQNQSGVSPFHLIFQKLTSASQIASLIPAVVAIARNEKELYQRNRRGENILHCLLINRNLGIKNKASLLFQIRKNIEPEELEELILQETLTDEIPYIYACSHKCEEDENSEKWKLLGLLVPHGGFFEVCNKMQIFLDVRKEEMFEFFVINANPSKSFEEFYDFAYIYQVNVIKALIQNGEYHVLPRYFKEKQLSFNIFVSHFFPAKTDRLREKPIHLVELLMRIDSKNEKFTAFIDNVIREFTDSMRTLFSTIKKINDWSLAVRYREFLYEMIARVYAEQIASKPIIERKIKKKQELVIKNINFFKKAFNLLYQTLSFGNKESEIRVMIKDIHYNALNSILRKTTSTPAQRKISADGLINLIKQLQKYFQEKDIGILIIDFLDYCLKNYKFNERLFKLLIKNNFSFVARSLPPSHYIDLVDDIFCFVHENRKKNFLKAIKNTPLFLFRLTLDRNSFKISDFKMDSDFETVVAYECVKLNKPFHLNLLRSIDKFNAFGFKAQKLNLAENMPEKKMPHIIRTSGIDFFTSNQDYRLCLKRTKKNLYEIAIKGRYFKIILILLEWEATTLKEFKGDRINVFKFLAHQGKFGFIKKDVWSKMSFNFKDMWLEGSFKEMKVVAEQIFAMSAEDFKLKFLKSNVKEILSTKIRDEVLEDVCRNLRIEVNDIKDDFVLIHEKPNGFEILVDKKYMKSLRFFVDHYLVNISKDLKNETFMKIFNNRMKYSQFNLFETLILNNEFKFFYDNKKRLTFEKIDISKLSISDPDGTYNKMFSAQIQNFFLFCYIFEISDQTSLQNLYCTVTNIPKRPYILPCILGFMLLNCRWCGDFYKNEKERVLNILKGNCFNQNVIESILKHQIQINRKLTALKYVLNDEKVLFEKSLCSFRCQLTHLIDSWNKSFKIEAKNEKNFTIRNLIDSSKSLISEKDTVQVDCPWLVLDDKKLGFNLNVLEKIILLIDANYMEGSFSYFHINFAADYLKNGCYFTVHVNEKEFKGSKDVIIQENSEDVNEPVITIKGEMQTVGEGFINYSILYPCVSEYKLW